MKEIVFKGAKAEGKVSPPPSKSHTHRAIIMAALSGGKCRITNPLVSLDTQATMDAVRTMGAVVTEEPGAVTVDGTVNHAPDREVDVKNSGTTLRIMTAVSATYDQIVDLTGDYYLRKRPMAPLLKALHECGVKVASTEEGTAPVKVQGPITGDAMEIKGNVSSQFITGLIMAAPLAQHDITVKVRGQIVSRPYIDITLSMMKRFGVEVETEVEQLQQGPLSLNRAAYGPDKSEITHFKVKKQNYVPADYAVPADFSSAAFPLVAGALGGKVTVTGMDLGDAQGDKKIIDILKKVGCTIEVNGDEVTCYRTGDLQAAEINMGSVPDLFPIVCILLATAKGTSRLYGAPQLKFKESDRIAVMVKMLKDLGAKVKATDDGCLIKGVERLHGARIDHSNDHRMMMAGAIASLVADGPVSMEDDGCWEVSYPGFVEQMQSLGFEVETREAEPEETDDF